MARASKVAAKPKKKTVRVARRGVNRFALAPTDDWNKAKHFVHYEIESKEWGTKIKEYIKKNFDKKTVSNINKLPDWKVTNYSHWAATAFLSEANPDIIPDAYREGIVKWVNRLSDEGAAVAEAKKEEAEKPKNIHKPNIQERIFEQSQDACDAIEEWLEGYIVDPKNFDPKGFDFTAHFAKTKVTQAHARKIKKFYESWLGEARVVADMPTPAQIKKIKDEREADYAQQIREGYAHIRKADTKKWVEALENLMGACDLVIDTAKATRKPRIKKAPSKEKIVAKLKYKETDEKYQLASVNPLELIDSSEIWVFNAKTRKLGKYVADEYSRTMSVKGSTLVGFDEAKSVQKTLRKPEETLKEFKKAGKVKLRKFLNELTTTETKLNGRINSDTIILRVN